MILLPPILRVVVGVADLRREPDRGSELVDQVRFGEELTLLRSSGDWHFVQAREDHYFGWIETTSVHGSARVPGAYVVAVNLAALRREPGGESVDALPAGTWLSPDDQPAHGHVRVGHGWLDLRDLTPLGEVPARAPTPEDLVGAARAFLDVPYVWGGTSARGLDCSGFVQLAYRLCGVRLVRDADQQATQGRAVAEPRTGDLVFFGSPLATHVGMALGRSRMIHASGSERRVLEQEIAARGDPVANRRYLPD